MAGPQPGFVLWQFPRLQGSAFTGVRAFVSARLGQLPRAFFTEAPGSLYIHSNPPGCSYLRKTKRLRPAGRSERDPGSASLGRGAAYLKHLTEW